MSRCFDTAALDGDERETGREEEEEKEEVIWAREGVFTLPGRALL